MNNSELEQELPERVRAARARLRAIIERDGIKPFSIEDSHKNTWPEQDPDDSFLKVLREWRNEGTERQ